MQKIAAVAVLCASCLVSAGVAGAQSASLPESAITIRATVSEVALDLVVRDKKGKVVKTLKPGDLAILEDGVPQPLTSFRLVTGSGGQPLAPAAAETPGPAAAPASAKQVSLPLKAMNIVCIVFQGLDPGTKKWAVDAVREFLKGDLPPDAWVGIFNLTSRVSVVQPFTTRRNDLIQAANNAFTGPSVDFMASANTVLSANPTLVWVGGDATHPGGEMHISGGELNNSAIADADVETSQSANYQRGDMASQNRQFGHIDAARQADHVIAMIRQFATLPGRKTVLLFSPGLTNTGDPDRFQKIVAAANQANVTFYGVDVHGLSENSSSLAGKTAMSHVTSLSQQQSANDPIGATGIAGVEMTKMRQDDELHNAVRGSDPQAALRALSEGTGGFMIANTNDLRKPFQRIVDDVDTHYEAVYRPTSGKFDGRLRKIEIKLARPDLTVESRAGYFAMPDIKGSPVKAFETPALLVLNDKPQPHAFDFRSAAFGFRPGAESTQYAVSYEVPVSSVTATPQLEQKRHHLHLVLFALVKDASGQVVDKFSQDAPYDIPDERMPALQAVSIPYTHVLNLPPGRYTVETAVLDREGARATTNVVPIDIPESKGIGLSSVMLVKQVEAASGPDAADPFLVGTNRVTPELETTLKASAKPYVYFVVYPDKASAEKPTIEVQLLLNGAVLAKQTVDLPAADATGAVPMVIGSVAKKGECEMKIVATQGGQSLARSVKYTVAAD